MFVNMYKVWTKNIKTGTLNFFILEFKQRYVHIWATCIIKWWWLDVLKEIIMSRQSQDESVPV